MEVQGMCKDYAHVAVTRMDYYHWASGRQVVLAVLLPESQLKSSGRQVVEMKINQELV